MTAKILCVPHQKGGVGKSTVTMVVAGELGERGYRVLVADADPQATASHWAAAGEQPFPAAVVGMAAAGAKIHRELKQHVENYDYILVDCPPSLESQTAASVLLVADLALIPVAPSPPDLYATSELRALIERAQAMNEDLRAAFVLNRVQRTTVSTQTRALVEQIGLPMLKASLGMRTAFQEASGFGCTVAALGKSAAADEVAALVDEIESMIPAESRPSRPMQRMRLTAAAPSLSETTEAKPARVKH